MKQAQIPEVEANELDAVADHLQFLAPDSDAAAALGCYLVKSTGRGNRLISRREWRSLPADSRTSATPVLPGDFLVNWGAFGVSFVNHYALYAGSLSDEECGYVVEVESCVDASSVINVALALWRIVTRGYTPGKIAAHRDASEMAWNYGPRGRGTRRRVARYDSDIGLAQRVRRLRTCARFLRATKARRRWRYDFLMYNCKAWVHEMDGQWKEDRPQCLHSGR